MSTKRGLYANINAKRKRIAAGSGEKCVNPQSRRSYNQRFQKISRNC
jgi:hypothetical protein